MVKRKSMMSAWARLTAVVFLASACFVANGSTAAWATTYYRQRSAAERWAPQVNQFFVDSIDRLNTNLQWNSEWGDQHYMGELIGTQRAFKTKAKVNYQFANTYNGYTWSNYPSLATPFEVTLASSGENNTNPSFGFGVANTNYLYTGVFFQAIVGVYQGYYVPGASFPMQIDVRAATTETSITGVNCSDPSQVTFCVFDDYTLNGVRSRNFFPQQGADYGFTWYENYLYNQSFEQAFDGWTSSPGTNRAVYCDSTVAFDGSCYLQMNRGSNSYGEIYQDVAPWGGDVEATDNYTLETMLQCPTGQGVSSCSVQLAYWGTGVTAGEYRAETVSVPSDGGWYMCQLDYEHGAQAGLASNHNNVRVQIDNLSTVNMNVDYVALSQYKDVVSTPSDPVAGPSAGAACVPAYLYAFGGE